MAEFRMARLWRIGSHPAQSDQARSDQAGGGLRVLSRLKALRHLPGFAAVGLALLAALLPVQPPRAWAQEPHDVATCTAVGDLRFVCGLTNVEDFLPVGGGRWLVGSAMKSGSAGLYLIDTNAKTGKPVALSIAARPDPAYAGCPAPDLAKLETHGLDVVAGRGGLTTVYAVNHGGREAVEVFRLQAAQGKAEWVGCVMMPDGVIPNSLAALPTGGFVVTKWLDGHDKQGLEHVLAGQINGAVYRWRPGMGFSEVAGTHFSGDNGVLVSPDGRWVYVNAWGGLGIYRVPLSGHGPIRSVRVDFHPDNLRWAPDGKIFVTGQYFRPKMAPGPSLGWITVKLDPQTMAITPVVREPGYAQFDSATSTVQTGRVLWFGTYHGDRIAYRAVP